MPVQIIITSGTIADSSQVPQLIQGIEAQSLVADRGYDTNKVLEAVEEAGMKAVIPPKKNRREQRDYDRAIYKFRHIVENTFLELKRWRGIATRYAKQTSSYIASVQICCMVMWLKILWPHYLEKAVGESLSKLKRLDAVGWFRHCGYSS